MDNIMRFGYTWFYTRIEEYAIENNYEITELGEELIGEHFLILKNEKGDVGSFVFDGVREGEYLYKCIHID